MTRVRYLSKEDLKHLARSPSTAVVDCINENEPGFMAVYKHDRSCSNPLSLKYMIKILYNLVKSNEEALASRVLGQILSQEGDFAIFLFHLDQLLKMMPTEIRSHVRDENPRYLNYLIQIGRFAIEHIPASVVSTFPKSPLQSTIQELVKQGEQLDIQRREVEELVQLFDEALQELIRTKQPKENDSSSEQTDPPEHFTTLELLPAAKEIQSDEKKPFLRPNIIRGAYQNWDHYLDVQFRLLREDFVAPLRRGIHGCYEGLTGRKLPEVRIYDRVQVLAPVCLFTGMGFQVRFDTRHLSKVKWEHSRRLIYGSLLCLSQDDFKTITYATVVKRDPKLLEDGLLTIKFEGDTNGFEIDPNEEFTMVESTAYFEAYRHVLEGLQKASTSADTMPFKRYIVECQMQEIPSPLYIRTTGCSASFNLSEALGLKKTKPRITITDASHWPHADETNLDKSQLKAVQMALSQEISVIQGPPGTGKTHIGLKIVQAFLQNRQTWDRLSNSPILVVCYTNHALDQFLEGIKDCQVQGKEPNIIRIGGRCKSEKLANCVLYTKVQNCRSERSVPGKIHREWMAVRNELFRLKKDIEQTLEDIDTSEGKILALTILESVIPEDHKLQLTHGIPTDIGKEIEVWLGLWYPQTQPYPLFDQLEDEDEALARALQETLIDHGPEEAAVPPNEQAAGDGQQAAGDELAAGDGQQAAGDEQYIQVDEEARLLQEERLLEGEEIELGNWQEGEPPAEALAYGDPPPANNSGWQVVQMNDRERKRRIERGFRYRPMGTNKAQEVEDIHTLSPKDKWGLYHYWVNKHLKQRKHQLARAAERYNGICELYTECQEQLHGHVIKGADVIGMTTTGAAKHNYVLKSIHPKIVVIEEAAEVFESHIVTSLSPSVQQLILIGDHKQLRPKPNHYELDKKYGFAVSLFERLTRNGIPYTTLEVQHRMRPEIAQLVCPHIYKTLRNHESVEGYEHIRGVSKDLFFIDHQSPEKSNPDGDMRSHANFHEADFLVALCRYLLKQGYRPEQITLLTMYRGQLLEMRNRMRREEFQGVRVAAVDDFQGEENDIILLSLVRSNSDGDVGFLKVENRVCVALSRARMGMYVIGNLTMLRDKDNTVWPEILTDMDQKQNIGKALPLCCQIHSDQKVAAKTAEDFSQCPEGGCKKPCGTRLKCGHVCPRLCHPYDMEHQNHSCRKQCTKTLPCGHQCTRKCYECAEGCQGCKIIVPKRMPDCGHTMSLQCHVDPRKQKCIMQCSKLLGCGHLCQEMCSQPCTVKCMVPDTMSLSCGHSVDGRCYEKDILCPKPCQKQLDCEHLCSSTCGGCHSGRLHVRCQHQCRRELTCGHLCSFPCTPNCPPCMQPCTNYCVHSRCPRRCYEPCDPCMEPCPWKCQHFKCTSKCGEMCNRPRCNVPCDKRLKCGHRCIGLCGEECPKLCRVCNRDEVCEIFFGNEEDDDAQFVELKDCGHVIEVEGLDAWMQMSREGNAIAVQLKACPKCKTPIRRSLRYGNIIKDTLLDLEEIKQKQLIMSPADIQRKVRATMLETESLVDIRDDLKKLNAIVHPPLQRGQKFYLSPHSINTISTQLAILPHIGSVYDTLNAVKCSSCQFSRCNVEIRAIRQETRVLQEFLMCDFLSEQQLSDIQCELRRLMCTAKLCDLKFKVQTKKCQVAAHDQGKLDRIASRVYVSGWSGQPKMTPDAEQEVSDLIAHFNEQYSVSGLSEAERIKIVQAIGLTKGHWFKCPKGHYYCIGECGGASQVGQCPDCGAQIGGERHQLLPDNQLAPEMDGASYAAWSDIANMQNYDFQ